MALNEAVTLTLTLTLTLTPTLTPTPSLTLALTLARTLSRLRSKRPGWIGARSARASARRAACARACTAARRSSTTRGCSRASSATPAARQAAYPSAWWTAAWSGSPRVNAACLAPASGVGGQSDEGRFLAMVVYSKKTHAGLAQLQAAPTTHSKISKPAARGTGDGRRWTNANCSLEALHRSRRRTAVVRWKQRTKRRVASISSGSRSGFGWVHQRFHKILIVTQSESPVEKRHHVFPGPVCRCAAFPHITCAGGVITRS